MTNDWQVYRMGDLLAQNFNGVKVLPDKSYKLLGVRLQGRGTFLREEKSGSNISANILYPVRAGDFIYSRLFAWRGAFDIVPEALDGCFVSGEFPTFTINTDKLLPKFLQLSFARSVVWEKVEALCTGTTKASRNRFKEQFFLSFEIPVPPLEEQRHIVTYIETLSKKINEVKNAKQEIETNLDKMLLSAYHSIADNADRKPMEEVAPLTRRPANVSLEENYPQVSVRSFGRGTFHKPELEGGEITWQKPYLVKSGDILISNIKAWEGAIAVASESDDGRYGSHRYLTCVPISNIATSRFVCFHLLTSEGLYEVGQASPGSADRNRTLGAKALMQIPIPTPPIEKQLWFDQLYRKVNTLRELQSASGEELSALMPSILDKAFKGEL
jgi:type I restriction enzyme S subunit